MLRFLSAFTVLLGIFLYFWLQTFERPAMPVQCLVFGFHCPSRVVTGYVARGYEPVKELLSKHMKDGLSAGAAVAGFVDGECVFNVAGGWGDAAYERIFFNQTLVNIFSSSKVVTSLVVALLVDRGLLSYDEKIARYWPEFGVGNKEDVTLRDLMRHEGGVAWLDHKIDLEFIRNEAKLSQLLAETSHTHGGNKRRIYHGMLRGLFIDEVVRRVDPNKRKVRDIFRQDIAEPAGIGNQIFYGLPSNLEYRVADIRPFNFPKLLMAYLSTLAGAQKILDPVAMKLVAALQNTSSELFKGTVNAVDLGNAVFDSPEASAFNSRLWRDLSLPSGNVHATAYALAKALSLATRSGATKVELWEGDGLDAALAMAPDARQYDLAAQSETVMSDGGWGVLDLPAEGEYLCNLLQSDPCYFDEMGQGRWYGWHGAGGSIALFAPDLGLSFAFVQNSMYTFEQYGKGGRSLLAEFVKQWRNPPPPPQEHEQDESFRESI
mmetsp:Transcript_52488/g.122794  ORF Transcript_52488/g.122794 Transcript_52488/m.122794 type:complete len:491 (-) Transcript_52488:43-1515(-)